MPHSESTMSNNTDAAKENAVQQAKMWAQEARTQRETVLSILRYFGLPERDWEALRLIQGLHLSAGAQPAAQEPAEPWGIRCDETGYLRTFRTREQRDHFLVTVGTAGAIKPELFGPDDATAPHPAPQQPDARDAERLEKLRMTLEVIAVGDSLHPRADAAAALVEIGFWRPDASPPAADARDALVRELVEALNHAVEIAENKRSGNWDDLLQYRALAIKAKESTS